MGQTEERKKSSTESNNINRKIVDSLYHNYRTMVHGEYACEFIEDVSGKKEMWTLSVIMDCLH